MATEMTPDTYWPPRDIGGGGAWREPFIYWCVWEKSLRHRPAGGWIVTRCNSLADAKRQRADEYGSDFAVRPNAIAVAFADGPVVPIHIDGPVSECGRYWETLTMIDWSLAIAAMREDMYGPLPPPPARDDYGSVNLALDA